MNTTIAARSAQVIQDQWTTVGFKVTVELLDTVPFREARRRARFDAMIQGYTYRYDPDDFFARNLHSKSEYSESCQGWQNERYDQLVEEAKRTLDPARRKALYTEAWNIVNVELPFFYLHEVTQTSAAVKELRGYQPGLGGSVDLPGRRPAHRLYRGVTRAARRLLPGRCPASALAHPCGFDGSCHTGKGS